MNKGAIDDWQIAQSNSPQSIRQAMLYGTMAVLLVIGFFSLRYVLPTLAAGSATKGKATPCRRA